MTIVFSATNSRTVSGSDGRTLSSVDIGCSVQEEMNLSGRELTSLPDHVRKNSRIRILDLSRNCLGRTTAGLSGLGNLERLNLSVNELKRVDLDFGLLPFLEVLCLAGNELENLADGIVALHRLRRLHCDFNRLSSLPHDWSLLSTSLSTLTLSHNRLEAVPTTVWTLQCLQVLDLRRNRISNIGPLPEGGAALKELRLGWNRLSGRLDLSPLVNVTHLEVSHNDLEELEISKLHKLESLLATHNSLRALEMDGSRLRSFKADGNELEKITCTIVPLQLQFLDISHNNLRCLPEWIVDARSLHTVAANHNKLSLVPKELFLCGSLTDLRLDHNVLVQLPDLMTQCRLRHLRLQYNKFERLPDDFFWAFPCLESLNLSYNSLRFLPTACESSVHIKSLLLSGNQLGDQLNNLVHLLKLSRIESLHLACNGIAQLPEGFFESLGFLRTLSLSGNELKNISSQISKAHSLEKLYIHSNQLVTIPKFSETNNLQVLDLACNQIHQLELASIVPKDLTYLDLSANCSLQIDPTDFHHLCCQRSVAVVDVNCAGREAPLAAGDSPNNKKEEEETECPWILGFTESQDGNTRIYIEFQKETCSGGRQEALIALMEVDDPLEVAQLRSVLPHLLMAERERNHTYPDFLRNALLSSMRYLRSRGYEHDVGLTLCHLSSSSAGSPVTLRLGTVGRPSSCVLGRAGNVIVLAQRQDNPHVGMEEWAAVMQETEVCSNNHLSNLQSNSLSPGGTWTTLPEPEVRELVLSPQDKFLVFGDSGFAKSVPPDEVCRLVQQQGRSSPVAASKALAEMYSALEDRRECTAVILFRQQQQGGGGEVEEDVEKYRCWEFMLEQNHKLLFTRELETLHKTVVHHTADPVETTDLVDPTSWYTTALSKYKCPLPSHRGRYYCYGNKIDP